MPRRSKRTLRNLKPISREIAKLAGEAHSLSQRIINLSNKVNDIEAELDARRKAESNFRSKWNQENGGEVNV